MVRIMYKASATRVRVAPTRPSEDEDLKWRQLFSPQPSHYFTSYVPGIYQCVFLVGLPYLSYIKCLVVIHSRFIVKVVEDCSSLRMNSLLLRVPLWLALTVPIAGWHMNNGCWSWNQRSKPLATRCAK